VVVVFHPANADGGAHQNAISRALEATGAANVDAIMAKVMISKNASAGRESGLPLVYIYWLFNVGRRSS
jgi:hypothetical protein